MQDICYRVHIIWHMIDMQNIFKKIIIGHIKYMKIEKSSLKKVSIEYGALQNIITGDVLQVKILRIMS